MPLVLLLYALFASVFILAKFALQVTEPLFLIGVRMTLAGVLIALFLYGFQREKLRIKRKDLPHFILLGLTQIYLTNALEFWGLQYLTSFKTCFIYSLSPFASAFICWLAFSEKMNFKKGFGLVIGFLGFIPIFLYQTQEEVLSGALFSFSLAELAVMGAALSSVAGWILLKGLVFDKGYSPLLANGFAMGLGGVMALVHSFLRESWNPIPVTDLMSFILFGGALLIVSNLVCYNLYGYLLKRFSATFMSFAGFLTPLFTVLFGWIFLSEIPSTPFWISAIIVFSGLFLYYQEELVIKAPAQVS
jgi:drug/metabolite transporter (DMT)-like permease